MPNKLLAEMEEKMKKSVDVVRHELTGVRTGRANTALLDTIRVDYYGTMTPLTQVASVSAPDARMLVVQPWERTMVPVVEKAILRSDLGLTPSNDGQVIRLPIPPLTEQRRKDLAKTVGRLIEEGKVSVRNVRRDAMDALKKMEKDGSASEDDVKRAQVEVQKQTDKFIKMLDELAAKKTAELMEV
jgi:ribosome recycling factor